MSTPVALVAVLAALAVEDRYRGAVRRRVLPEGAPPELSAVLGGHKVQLAIPVLAGLVLAVALSAPVLALLGVGGTVGVHLARRARRTRAARRVQAQLPQLLEELARHLRAGGSLRSGLLELGEHPRRCELVGDVARALAAGAPLPEALRSWSASKDAGRRLAAAALALGSEAGGPQARALDAVAATLRERESVANEAHALSAQARASAAVLAVAPVLFGVLGALAMPGAADFLLRDPAGALCMSAGLALQGAGWYWMHRLSVVHT